jgi:RNA polymerase sigma-70 factor (ECF subfamily)
LIALADYHMSPNLAARIDAEDVVQSVFRTIFRRLSQGEFEINEKSQLWQLLVRITLMKARAKARHHTAALRTVRKETADFEDILEFASQQQPTPEEVLIFTEEIERLVKGLPDIYPDVVRLRLAGCTTREMAAQLNVSRTTVSRALALLRTRLGESAAAATSQLAIESTAECDKTSRDRNIED